MLALRRVQFATGLRLIGAAAVLLLSSLPQTVAAPPSSTDRELPAQLVLIPTADKSALMHTWVYRPPGKGPFPLAVINHGSSSNAELRLRQTRPRFRALTNWFVRHGYVVAVPQRPGHGETGGQYLEDYGSCDEPDYFHAGLEIGRSIATVVDEMNRRGFIRKGDVVLVGHSAGGWGSLALASLRTASVAAVVNFSGGLGGRSYDWANRNCAADVLVRAAGKYGLTTRIPTLWLYAENDSYFGAGLSRQLAQAYRDAGGIVEYHLLPPIGDDGHFLIYTEGTAATNWLSIVEKFLTKYQPRAAN